VQHQTHKQHQQHQQQQHIADGTSTRLAVEERPQSHLQAAALRPTCTSRFISLKHLRRACLSLASLPQDAAVLVPELCIAAHLRVAKLHGADLRFHEPLATWTPLQDGSSSGSGSGGCGFEVTTSSGCKFTCAQLVLSVGAWAPKVWADAELPEVSYRRYRCVTVDLRRAPQLTTTTSVLSSVSLSLPFPFLNSLYLPRCL
jgi:glycine/D-amino acid oxidase-like deaminating enzyme